MYRYHSCLVPNISTVPRYLVCFCLYYMYISPQINICFCINCSLDSFIDMREGERGNERWRDRERERDLEILYMYFVMSSIM